MNHKRYIRHVWRRTRIDRISLNRLDAETLECYFLITYGRPCRAGTKDFFVGVNKLALRFMKKTGWLRENITGKDLAEYAFGLRARRKRYCKKLPQKRCSNP